ncbi:hypothetical protein [Klebsiella pneumoniae IS10]|nr:hypothetical protein [Klebsiella pneumoniae IS10]
MQLHQQKGMISLSPPTICNSAVPATTWWEYLRKQVQELNSTGPSERKSWRLPSPDKLMQSWSLSFPGGGARRSICSIRYVNWRTGRFP